MLSRVCCKSLCWVNFACTHRSMMSSFTCKWEWAVRKLGQGKAIPSQPSGSTTQHIASSHHRIIPRTPVSSASARSIAAPGSHLLPIRAQRSLARPPRPRRGPRALASTYLLHVRTVLPGKLLRLEVVLGGGPCHSLEVDGRGPEVGELAPLVLSIGACVILESVVVPGQ